MSQQVHFRATEIDVKRLADLVKKLGTTATAVIREAIRLLHKKEITNVSKVLFIVALCILASSCGGAQIMMPQDGTLDPSPTPTPTPIPTIVFIGDSIFHCWANAESYCPDAPGLPVPAIDQGIPGNTSLQMEARFASDVLALHPKIVVIMAGTNDIDRISHVMPPPETIMDAQNALLNMIGTAKANGIKVIISTIPPDGFLPTAMILDWNAFVRQAAIDNNVGLADFFPVLAGPNNLPLPGVLTDGVHPNREGFSLMNPIVTQAIINLI